MTDASPKEAVILQRWKCYVDSITRSRVHLVMKDDAIDDPEEEYGSFPKKLLSHLEFGRGTYLTVTVRDDRTLTIEHSPPTYGPPSSLKLVDMLRRLQFD